MPMGVQGAGTRDRAFNTYFENDRYLDMMKKKFGPDVDRHLRDMVKHTLQRDYAVGPG